MTQKTSHLKFVIATLPDPVHTHLAVLFDQFAVSVQEGAQDEQYDFDSSWLPWDDQEASYALLLDEKAANEERELKERQPGIILFRKAIRCADVNEKENPKHLCKPDWGPSANSNELLSKPYREGLVVFVVGEEATHGIHRDQFRNALSWIAALKPKAATRIGPLAILGPTFSGSFPSIVQVLSEPEVAKELSLPPAPDGQRIEIFSGSVSSNDSARAFQEKFDSQVTFHSFVQNDNEILRRFCAYLAKEQHGFDLTRVAMISEDETAYGSAGITTAYDSAGDQLPEERVCHGDALELHYPRDISALRSAYQTKSCSTRERPRSRPKPKKEAFPAI